MLAFVKTATSMSGIALLVQAVPIPAVDPLAALLAAAGKLTVDAVLLGGLWWMAKQHAALLASKETAIAAKDAQLEKKDAQVVDMATKVTETMTLVMEAVKELRTTVSGLKLEYDDMPCSRWMEAKRVAER